MAKQYRSSNYFIYLAVAAVNLVSFTSGGCFAWPSPVLPKLNSTDLSVNPMQRPLTTFEQSWVAAIMNLGAVIGPFVGGVCSEKFGKRKTLLMVGVPMVISQLLCAFAVNIYFLLVARFIIGIGVGTVFGVVPGFVADIAEDNIRGVLGSFLGVASVAGALFIYTIGPFFSLRIFSLINLIPLILFYVLSWYCVPESPYDLIKRNNQKAAEESLMRLRNKSSGQIQKELQFIIDSIEESKASQSNGFLTIFKNKALTRGLLISNGLMFFQQFAGTCAVVGYMQTIFESAGGSIPAAYSTMLVGLIQLVFNVASANLVERAGRKILLITSFILVIISLVSLGAYFYLKVSGQNVDQISWLPIASLILYIMAFNLGLANIPWLSLGELFPADIKSFTSTITSFFVFFLSFIITMFFPLLNAAIGMAGSFWMFAGISVVGVIFSAILVPETKGKSNEEIQNILGKN